MPEIATHLPGALAAEAAAHPEQFRPPVEAGELVRVLYVDADEDATFSAIAGTVYSVSRMANSKFEVGESYYGLVCVDLGGGRGHYVDAWERWTP